MAEYIEKEAILRHLADVQFGEKTAQMWDGVEDAIQAVIHFPVADVVPVRHGRWKLHENGDGTCSECGNYQMHIWDLDHWQNFCGHCGAKMDLED